MRGYYKINGVVVPNLITTGGRKIIRRVLAGQGGVFGDAFVYGIGEKPATVNDTTLDFEIGRQTVTLRNPDDDTAQILFKTSLPIVDTFTIKEIGLYSSFSNSQSGDFGSRLLFNFEPGYESWTNGVYDTLVTNLGAASLKVSNATSGISTTSIEYPINLSGYSNSDEFKFAFQTNDDKTEQIVVRFKNDNSNYYEIVINDDLNVSKYHVISIKKGFANSYGNPNWASIASVEIEYSSLGAGSINFDAIRIEDLDTVNDYYVLISRAVLTTPIKKVAGKAMEIEYVVDVN